LRLPACRCRAEYAAGTGPVDGEWLVTTTFDEDQRLINNRQNGRRRGRGSGPRTPNSSPNPGNRQDNRSRGNAAQLHEKYKALARDTQLAGDRVQTEYYLQFADHYFRVLSEGRARYEEQRPRRDDYSGDEDEDQDQDEAVASDGNGRDDGDERQEREPRADRERTEREPRADREQRAEREREPRFQREANGEARQPRRQRPPRDRDEDQESGEARISLESLPPAITVLDGGEEGERTPRRRTRRPRTDNDEAEIAPAA